MTTPTDTTARRWYRLAPLDRTGWILGVSGLQCALLAVGVVAAGVLLNVGTHPGVIAAPVVAAVTLAFARWEDQPVHHLARLVFAWYAAGTDRRRWTRPLTQLSGTVGVWPGCFGRIELTYASMPSWPGRTVGIVVDDQEHTVTGVLAAEGRGLGLLDPGEQDRLLAGWGDALGGFSNLRNPVLRLAFSEWAAPAGGDAHLQHLADHADPDAEADAVAAYRDLLEQAAPAATRHEVLITVTVATDPGRGRRRRRRAATAGVEGLGEQLRLLAGRLENAGLSVRGPLSPVQLSAAVRARLDPTSIPALGLRARCLRDLPDPTSTACPGPMAWQSAWRHALADGSVHAGFWVADWPRVEIGATWLEPLLLHTGGARILTVLYEPVPAGTSRRQIERDAVRLASDEQQRQRGGWRVGARHLRASQAVAEREQELLSGFPELGYVGILLVTASSLDELERDCADLEQFAAAVGIELRRLDGQHDVAVPVALPLGRPIRTPLLT